MMGGFSFILISPICPRQFEECQCIIAEIQLWTETESEGLSWWPDRVLLYWGKLSDPEKEKLMIFPNFQSVRYLTSHCHYNSHFILIITFIRLVHRKELHFLISFVFNCSNWGFEVDKCFNYHLHIIKISSTRSTPTLLVFSNNYLNVVLCLRPRESQTVFCQSFTAPAWKCQPSQDYRGLNTEIVIWSCLYL